MQNTPARNWLLRAAAPAAAALLASAALSSSFAGGAPPPETGVWYDDTGKGAVKIEPCGTKLCGRIVWLQDLVNDKGEILTDKNNPDPAQRTRTICGLPVLGQLKLMPEGGYDGGWVYDPKVGKSYTVAIALNGRDTLAVTGYLGVKLLGKNLTWKRAKDDLPSCAAAARDAKATDGKSTDGKAKATDAKAGATKKAGGETLPWAAAKPANAGTAAKPAKPSANAQPAEQQ